MGLEQTEDVSDDCLFELVAETLENVFGKQEFSFTITVIIASRNGLSENELISLLDQNQIVKEGNLRRTVTWVYELKTN